LIDKHQARVIAEGVLAVRRLEDGMTPVVTSIEESNWAWVIRYKHPLFRSHDQTPEYALYGGGPIIVDKSDGTVWPTGSGMAVEAWLEEYTDVRSRLQKASNGKEIEDAIRGANPHQSCVVKILRTGAVPEVTWFRAVLEDLHSDRQWLRIAGISEFEVELWYCFWDYPGGKIQKYVNGMRRRRKEQNGVQS
jgi:hypothetical protein